MRYVCLAFVATVLLHPFSAFAQKGPCTEEFIRTESAKPVPPPRTDDYYLFNPVLEKPVIGTEERNKANNALAPLMVKRKNMKSEPPKVDRVVVTPSGDMAYDYGTIDSSYDDSDTGNHVDATVAYLGIWRADGGLCKLAAMMLQREGQR